MPSSSAVSAEASAIRRVVAARVLERDRQRGRRKHRRARLGPLDEHDRVVEVRLEVAPLRRRDAREAVEVEVRDVDRAGVAVADREGRARDRRGHAERAAGAAHERRLARAELARDGDDVARSRAARRGRPRSARSRSPRRWRARCARQKRPSWTDSGLRLRRRRPALPLAAGSSTVRSSSAGMRAKSSSSTFSIDGV